MNNPLMNKTSAFNNLKTSRLSFRYILLVISFLFLLLVPLFFILDSDNEVLACKKSGKGTGNYNCCNRERRRRKMPQCGTYNGRVYGHAETSWGIGSFCSRGRVNFDPIFPNQGETRSWICTLTDRRVSCSARRLEDTDQPPRCGTLHESKFTPEISTWPSQDFCAVGIAYYLDDRVDPLFPGVDERVDWECRRGEEKTDCWAQREEPPPPPPECGSLGDPEPLSCFYGSVEGRYYLPSQKEWPGDNFCNVGTVKPAPPPEPTFPDPQPKVKETAWGYSPWECCVEDDCIPCVACRCVAPEIGPACGYYDQEVYQGHTQYGENGGEMPDYWPNGLGWPLGEAKEYFCLSGDIDAPGKPLNVIPSIPVWPTGTEASESTWGCLKDGRREICTAARTPEGFVPPSPWISTRGGLVHVEGDIKMSILSVVYSSSLYRNAVSFASNEETSLSTELLTSAVEINDGNLGWLNQIYRLSNYSKRINYGWYDVLLSRAQIRDPHKTSWSILESASDLNICKEDQHIYFVEEDLVVNPGVFKDFGGVNDSYGCIFVAKQDVIIDSSLTADGFATVRGFFISDGIIYLGGKENLSKKGLVVLGGLFTNKSIELNIASGLSTLKTPSAFISHDARYLDLARKVFGSVGYVRDVGFKE